MKKISQIGFTIYMVCLFLLTLVPFRFRAIAIHHLPWPIGPNELGRVDLTANIILFIPLGFFLHFLIPKKTRSGRAMPYHSVWKSLLIGGGISFLIETVQIIIPARFPSFTDLLANTLGAGIGALMGIFFEAKNILFYFRPHRQKIFLAALLSYSALLFSLPFFTLDPVVNWHKGGSILIGDNVERERAWKGRLLSSAIYDRALLDEEIQQNFEKGHAVPTKDPSLHYLFDNRGMDFTGATFLSNKEDGAKVYERINASRAFSVEVWFYPARQFDHGGRILSLASPHRDFFYLRQSRDEMAFSVEGSAFRKGHIYWENVESIFSEPNRPVHIVGVYHRGALALYFNGEKVKEGHMGNGFFLVYNQFNFSRMDFGGGGLLAILLFWPLGLLLAMVSQSRHNIVKAVIGLSFVSLILLIEGQQTPSFFTPRTVWIPGIALLLGLFLGKKVTATLRD